FELVSSNRKLGENNFDVWSMSMRSVLVAADLWAVVSGKYIKPGESAALAAKFHFSVDQKAPAHIILNVKPTQFMHIK
ncbi:hypothetical protein KR009_009001, partial [Drosophila setifemur]